MIDGAVFEVDINYDEPGFENFPYRVYVRKLHNVEERRMMFFWCMDNIEFFEKSSNWNGINFFFTCEEDVVKFKLTFE